MADLGITDDVLAFIQRTAHALSMDQVILFGSRAKGSFTEKSDIDLAFSGESVHEFESALEEQCPTLLAFDFVNLDSNISEGLRMRISQEGIMLYG